MRGIVIEKENIYTNCEPKSKEEVIREIGQIFAREGYTNVDYTEAMLEKEQQFNTNIGNMVAIPHGTEKAKQDIMRTGLVIMTFPDGIDWESNEKVKVVIGIAAIVDEHMDILAGIAQRIYDKDIAERVAHMSADEIYELFSH